MTAARKIFRVKGTTDDVTTCGQCGREDLKGTIVLAHLDADGNEGDVTYLGSDCGARAAGWTQSQIRKAASAADREAKRQAEVERQRKDNAERDEFEAAFSNWLLAVHGTRDETTVLRRLGLRTRFRLVVEFQRSR